MIFARAEIRKGGNAATRANAERTGAIQRGGAFRNMLTNLVNRFAPGRRANPKTPARRGRAAR